MAGVEEGDEDVVIALLQGHHTEDNVATLREINLSHQNLELLPEQFFDRHFPVLERIDVSHNKLKSLPDKFNPAPPVYQTVSKYATKNTLPLEGNELYKQIVLVKIEIHFITPGSSKVLLYRLRTRSN